MGLFFRSISSHHRFLAGPIAEQGMLEQSFNACISSPPPIRSGWIQKRKSSTCGMDVFLPVRQVTSAEFLFVNLFRFLAFFALSFFDVDEFFHILSLQNTDYY